jgi:hypothetical protein
MDDSAEGDGDGAADPGETLDLVVHVANCGLETASEAWMIPVSPPAWLSIRQTGGLPAIPMDGVGDALFSATLSQDAPSPCFSPIPFSLGSGFWSGLDSLLFCTGTAGLETDAEQGPEGWTSSGTLDLWSITSSQHHSGSSSWHCGNDPGYEPGMDCGLTSPAFVSGPGPDLSFWVKYDTAIYGVDGLYVIVRPDGGDPDTLDFIGSGGALGYSPSGVGADWTPFLYDLPLEPGDSARVEFRFVSDSDAETGGGFYLDDMVVAGGWEGSPGQPGGTGGSAPLLAMPFPSPCRGALRVELDLPQEGPWELGVVDLAGRLASSQTIPGPGRGLLSLDLSGQPDGMYFLVLTGPRRATRAFVLLKGR